LDLENLVVAVSSLACQLDVDTEVDDFAEGKGTSNEKKVDMLGVVHVLGHGMLELGFVLLVRQQVLCLPSSVVSYKPWHQNELSAAVPEG
jgi:hypothetical protein